MGNTTRPGPTESSRTFGANTDLERRHGGWGWERREGRWGQEAGHTGWLEEGRESKALTLT